MLYALAGFPFFLFHQRSSAADVQIFVDVHRRSAAVNQKLFPSRAQDVPRLFSNRPAIRGNGEPQRLARAIASFTRAIGRKRFNGRSDNSMNPYLR